MPEVGYVKTGESRLIYDTRTALSLKRAGVPESQWTLREVTDTRALAKMSERLANNNLGAGGMDRIRILGAGEEASVIRGIGNWTPKR